MNLRKIAALLLALTLLPLSGAQAISLTDSVTINRRVDSNIAKTLDYMPEAARARTDTLVIGVTDLMGEFNPFWAQTLGDNYAVSLLYDELVFANNAGELGPGVASFSRSLDGTTYTFTIGENVRYADGVQVTSDDFINALYLLLMPGYDGVYDLSRAGILGVQAYLDGKTDSIAGITRADDRSFHVTLLTQNEANLIHFAIPALRVSIFGDMRRPASLTEPSDFADHYARSLESARNTDPVDMAYGQYCFGAYTPGEKAVLTKNESYWRGTPYIGTIELLMVPDGLELQYIMDGTVDIVNVLASVEAVDTVADFETGFINLYTWEGDILGYLGMDLDSIMFSQSGVRQALAIGFDREAARRGRIERYGVVPDMILFDGFSVQNKNLLADTFPYDPARAAQLLDEAGWVLGEDGLRHLDEHTFSFTLTYNTPNPVMDVVVQQMVEDYRELGIEVMIDPAPFAELNRRIDAGECQMYSRARRLPASPILASDLFVGDSHLNDSGYDSEIMERFRQMADESDDPLRQTVLYEMLFQELYLDMPFIPLYRRSEFLLVNARVMNLTITTSHDITADAYRLFFTDTLEGIW